MKKNNILKLFLGFALIASWAFAVGSALSNKKDIKPVGDFGGGSWDVAHASLLEYDDENRQYNGTVTLEYLNEFEIAWYNGSYYCNCFINKYFPHWCLSCY